MSITPSQVIIGAKAGWNLWGKFKAWRAKRKEAKRTLKAVRGE